MNSPRCKIYNLVDAFNCGMAGKMAYNELKSEENESIWIGN
jgi:hypothetical protein